MSTSALITSNDSKAVQSREPPDTGVASTWVYPPEYTGPAPIGEQIDKLAALFGLSPGETMRFVEQVMMPALTLPDGAEGWFAIPSVNAIAKRHFKSVTNPNERYCRASLIALGLLKASRRLYNYREGQITPDDLLQHARTVMMLEQITARQKGDILVIPAQFGLRHRNKSVDCSRTSFCRDEFGLGVLANVSMALTHPSRFTRWEQLHVDCSGDEFALGLGGCDAFFGGAPILVFDGNRFVLDAVPVAHESIRYGSSSGFLPQ